MQFLLRKNLIQARTIFLPFFSICPSFFVKPGTKAPVSRLHFILLHRDQSMIIFIEILSIEVTICFRTQVNGKKKERKWRDKEERRVGRRERANATGGTEAVNLDRTCFKFWIYNFTCMQIQ